MKKILLTAAIIFMALFSFAQTGDPLRDKLDSIFKFVDKTQIPTGYLKEYGSEMIPLHLFNGLLTDSNKVESLDILRYAYADLATAKIVTALPAKFILKVFGNSSFNDLCQQYSITDSINLQKEPGRFALTSLTIRKIVYKKT